MKTAPELNETFVSIYEPPGRMDQLWSRGWRHFGPVFTRYSRSLEFDVPQVVQPLRVRLETKRLRKSHRRVLRRNLDLDVRFGRASLDSRRLRLFEAHKVRFSKNVPNSLLDFLGPSLSLYPCELVEVTAWKAENLVAASYLDVGRLGASSVYAMFDPAESRRGLGISTMIWEMLYAHKRGCRFYYPGYAFHEPSILDYKKQFPDTEWYPWTGRWRKLNGWVGGAKRG